MKTLLLALLALPALALAQGSLTPSAAPSPTMKTLDQLEARTPIGKVGGSTAYIGISQPGSYVLMGNITVSSGTAIRISSSNVTLDLNGFTLTSTAASPNGYGVLIDNNLHQITVGNGHIQGSGSIAENTYTGTGFNYGVCCFYPSTRQVYVHDLSVNSVAQDGIVFADNQKNATGVVERCSVRTCGQRGIVAEFVRDSQTEDCNLSAIVATKQAVRCSGQTVTPTYGNTCIDAGEAIDCIGTATKGAAITTTGNASGCRGTSTSGAGILCNGSASNCIGISTSNIGLYCLGSALNSRGTSTSGTYGVYVTHTADGCVGTNTGGGVALYARIAIGCAATSGTISAAHKYNMP